MDAETGILDMEECINDFITMYSAGNATTSTSLLWALSALTRNVPVLKQLVEEVVLCSLAAGISVQLTNILIFLC